MEELLAVLLQRAQRERGLASDLVEGAVHQLHGADGDAVPVHLPPHDALRALLLAGEDLEGALRVVLLPVGGGELDAAPIVGALRDPEAAAVSVLRQLLLRLELHGAVVGVLEVDVPEQRLGDDLPSVHRPERVRLHLLHEVVDLVLPAVAQDPRRHPAEEVPLRAGELVDDVGHDVGRVVGGLLRRVCVAVALRHGLRHEGLAPRRDVVHHLLPDEDRHRGRPPEEAGGVVDAGPGQPRVQELRDLVHRLLVALVAAKRQHVLLHRRRIRQWQIHRAFLSGSLIAIHFF